MEGQFNNQAENILDSYESTENALMDSFKAAALKVTTLYKDSLVQNRKSYAAGYQQALQDLYELISAQPENGFIPVNDVLAFARQRNNQLTSEMGYTPTPATNNHTTTTTNTHINNTKADLPANKIVVNPFQIDPHTQFTFSHEHASSHNIWDQNSILNECNKRRLPEVNSFMGRSMALDNNNWHEPPFKRGRSRREEQQQQQQQQFQLHQQQQLQLQQQQEQAQQQQLQLQQQLHLQQQHPPPSH